MPYDSNIFVNCPFDDEYYPLLKSLLFTLISCGFNPRLARTHDSSNTRINQLYLLIKSSRYSIHDLSRMEPMGKNELPRFNMPFELGLDLGCKQYFLEDKRCLILEKERYRYQKVLSDISGQHIANHNNNPQTLIRKVRNWVFNLNSWKRSKVSSVYDNLG